MKKNSSSYFPLKMLSPSAPNGVMFGPTEFKSERDYLYPERRLKLNSTIIWVPEKQVHIGIASYVDAQKNGDEAALERERSDQPARVVGIAHAHRVRGAVRL